MMHVKYIGLMLQRHWWSLLDSRNGKEWKCKFGWSEEGRQGTLQCRVSFLLQILWTVVQWFVKF